MATPNRPGRPAIEPQRTGLLLAAIPAFLSSSSPLTIAGEARSRQARPLHRARRLRMLAAMMILCVTPNVAIDRTLSVSGFAAGGVWRAQAVRAAAGGKGLNVARALLGLGQSMCCAGPLGGRTGRQVAALADAEGLPARWTWIGGETRTSVIVVGDGGETTVINEPGPCFRSTSGGASLPMSAGVARYERSGVGRGHRGGALGQQGQRQGGGRLARPGGEGPGRGT